MSAAYVYGLIYRYWFLPIVGLLLGVGTALLAVMVSTTYSTSAVILVQPPSATAARYSSQPQRFVLTEAKVLTSDRVFAIAAHVLPDTSPADLKASVSVTGGTVDDTLTLTATGNTEGESRKRVLAISNSYQGLSRDAQTQVLSISSPALAISRSRAYLEGAGGGVAIGLLVVFAIGIVRRPVLSSNVLLDDRLRSVYPYDIPKGGEPGDYERLLDWVSGELAQTRSGVSVVGVGDERNAVVLARNLQSAASQRLTSGAAESEIDDPRILAPGEAHPVPTKQFGFLYVIKRGTPRRRLEQSVLLHGEDAKALFVVSK